MRSLICLFVLLFGGARIDGLANERAVQRQAEMDVDSEALGGTGYAVAQIRVVTVAPHKQINALLEMGRQCGKSEGAVVRAIDDRRSQLSWRVSANEQQWEDCLRDAAQVTGLPLFPL